MTDLFDLRLAADHHGLCLRHIRRVALAGRTVVYTGFWEKLMRLIAKVCLVAVATLLAACQILPYEQNTRFTTWSDADLQPRTVRYPTMLTFPDNTMFFYPIYDVAPRSDLVLRGLNCARREDGSLVVLARVQNMGSDIIAATPLLTSADLGAFRVAATLTTATGEYYPVDAYQIVPLTVSATVVLALNSANAKPSDITRIDVVVDPDSIVPDPIRENNRLSWQGTLDPANPRCQVDR
jgi:hypothetical protein